MIAGLLGGDDGVGLIGFELGELQVETFEVELGYVTGLVALVTDFYFMFVVGEIVVGELFGGFGDDEVGKGLTDREDGLLGGELELGVSLGCGRAGCVEAPFALVAALKEASDAER